MPNADSLLKGLPIHWRGVDDATPAGCSLVSTEVVGLPTTYILRDGQIIGRVELKDHQQYGYVGAGLKGGRYVGSGGFSGLANMIKLMADQAAQD